MTWYWYLNAANNVLGLPDFIFQIGTGAVPALVFVIVILWKKLWAKDEEVKALNDLILKDSKETLALLNGFEHTMNKLLSEINDNHALIQQTLEYAVENIIHKIEDIKKINSERIKSINKRGSKG